MGKGQRLRATRPAGPGVRQREAIWVDACEIDRYGAFLTIRAGSIGERPLVIALPAVAVSTLPDSLHVASVDAEEEYWDVVTPLVRSVPSPHANSEAVNAVVSAWVLSQDWLAATDRRSRADDELFIVSYSGFVGLGIGPPFTPEPVLAIFDPLQLRRLGTAFRDVIADAIRSAPAPWDEGTLTATVRFLAEKPWPSPQPVDAADAEAQAEMRDRRIEFLSRPPHLRPASPPP